MPSNQEIKSNDVESVSNVVDSADPFAPREGKTLLWRNINMTLKGKGDEPERKLLDDVWGEVPQKQTTAILGPSGAGKTSLLNILAGRASSSGPLKIGFDIRVNNHVVDPTKMEIRKQIAFVAQDDSLQVTSTPREAIYFSAKLRLPKSTSEEALEQLTNRMLEELGLTRCADTIVGGDLVKGISGGERKRTSVGVELVVRPSIVCLDEPTSGLDSYSAIQLCQVLKKVANAGSSVLFTIHQPASEIFSSFDRLILVNQGRIMYQGLVQDLPAYFEERGQPVPPLYNPADHIMNVAQSVSLEELDNANFFPKDERNLEAALAGHEDGKDALGITLRDEDGVNDFDPTQPGLGTQLGMLLAREFKNFHRDVDALGARMGVAVFLSVLVGIIFFDVGESDSADNSNLNSHFGALTLVLVNAMFGTAQPALLAFPAERPVFLREYSTNHYSVVSYFLSKLTVEAVVTAVQVLIMEAILYFMISFQNSFHMFFLQVYALSMASTAIAVMLGSAIEDPKMGQEMLPLLFVPQLLFAGFFVRPDLIPAWLRWPRYLCSLTYAIRIGLLGEFGDGCGGGVADENCARLLEGVGADKDEEWWNWLVIIAIFVVFRLMALIILQQKASKFL